MNKNYIETNRLILRRFEETDIDDFFECCQNPNLGIMPVGNRMKAKKNHWLF
jgi:RimJ/RimL family protein N-acetyltransferase